MSAGGASAFTPAGRWTSTATQASTGPTGSGVTLTWSIVPDGAWISTENEPSSLVAFLDGLWGSGPGGSDYTQRPWFGIVDDAFARWSELGGVRFIYEPHDDGAVVNSVPGLLGVRGDVRLSGASVDGPLGSLGHNQFPINGGDMVVDTDDGGFLGSSAADHRRLRNHLMHELGHGLGLAHVNSNDADFLLEPSFNHSFDGPQFDDILGLHSLYGDRFELDNQHAGNNTAAHATPLGKLVIGSPISLGTAAFQGTAVARGTTDFVSLSNQNDVDYYAFQLDQSAYVNLLLAPLGPTYQIGNKAAWDTSALSDLRLTLLDADGQVLHEWNDAPIGQAEIARGIRLDAPGEYLVRVSGDHYAPQMYLLHLAANTVADLPGDYNLDGRVDAADYTAWRDALGAAGPQRNLLATGPDSGFATWHANFGRSIDDPQLAGDFNHDGRVDAADYTLWRDTLGQVGLDLAADGDGNFIVDHRDYALWQANFGLTAASAASSVAAAVPEPKTSAWVLLSAAALVLRRRQRSKSAGGEPSDRFIAAE